MTTCCFKCKQTLQGSPAQLVHSGLMLAFSARVDQNHRSETIMLCMACNQDRLNGKPIPRTELNNWNPHLSA